MTSRRFLSVALSLVIFGVSLAVSYAFLASAQEHPDIDFPIAELGNCGSEAECLAYCDISGNLEACLDFGVRNGLMTAAEAERARQFGSILREGGPGGCISDDQCEAYCEDVSHIDECIAFAEERGLLPPEELDEARLMAQAVRSGVPLPGGCATKAQCEAYCSGASHIDECIAFAEAAGFMSPEEAAEARRVAPLIQRGETPGGCTDREQCEAYCEDEAHFNECADFAVRAGFISPEEAEIIRKTGGKGPGGCRGGEECRAYCETHAEECFEFAREHGIERSGEHGADAPDLGGLQETLRNAPDNVVTCIQNAVGDDVLARIRSGEYFPGPDVGERIRRCFEGFAPRPGDGFDGGDEFHDPNDFPSDFRGPDSFPSDFAGPGGCSTPEECFRYCSDPVHRAECGAGPGDTPPPDFDGNNFPPPPEEFRESDGFQDDFGSENFDEFTPPENFDDFERYPGDGVEDGSQSPGYTDEPQASFGGRLLGLLVNLLTPLLGR